MRILIVIALAITGLLLGFGVWQISANFTAGAWEKLPVPPGNIIELIPADDPPFYIRITDGTTYRYEEWHNRGWIETSIPQTFVNPMEVQQPCDLSAPEFFRWSNPPPSIVDCLQEKVMYADGFTRYTIVLDTHGDLWQSRITRTAYDLLNNLLCSLGLGLLLGLLAGILIAIYHSNQKIAEPGTIARGKAA